MPMPRKITDSQRALLRRVAIARRYVSAVSRVVPSNVELARMFGVTRGAIEQALAQETALRDDIPEAPLDFVPHDLRVKLGRYLTLPVINIAGSIMSDERTPEPGENTPVAPGTPATTGTPGTPDAPETIIPPLPVTTATQPEPFPPPTDPPEETDADSDDDEENSPE